MGREGWSTHSNKEKPSYWWNYQLAGCSRASNRREDIIYMNASCYQCASELDNTTNSSTHHAVLNHTASLSGKIRLKCHEASHHHMTVNGLTSGLKVNLLISLVGS